MATDLALLRTTDRGLYCEAGSQQCRAFGKPGDACEDASPHLFTVRASAR